MSEESFAIICLHFCKSGIFGFDPRFGDFEYQKTYCMADLESKKKFEIDGTILESLPGTKFMVKIDVKGVEKVIEAYISGKMRMNYIKLLVGDKVKLEMSPYDLGKGRIIYRY